MRSNGGQWRIDHPGFVAAFLCVFTQTGAPTSPGQVTLPGRVDPIEGCRTGRLSEEPLPLPKKSTGSGARCGIHRDTVHKITRRAGVPLRPRGFPDSIRQEAEKRYSEGQTIVQVAASLGISYEGARAGIIACGVTLRPREDRSYSAHDISLKHESNSDS